MGAFLEEFASGNDAAASAARLIALPTQTRLTPAAKRSLLVGPPGMMSTFRGRSIDERSDLISFRSVRPGAYRTSARPLAKPEVA